MLGTCIVPVASGDVTSVESTEVVQDITSIPCSSFQNHLYSTHPGGSTCKRLLGQDIYVLARRCLLAHTPQTVAKSWRCLINKISEMLVCILSVGCRMERGKCTLGRGLGPSSSKMLVCLYQTPSLHQCLLTGWSFLCAITFNSNQQPLINSPENNVHKYVSLSLSLQVGISKLWRDGVNT